MHHKLCHEVMFCRMLSLVIQAEYEGGDLAESGLCKFFLQ